MDGGKIEHSALGASSAERWMACPGSVALIQALGPSQDENEPEYREEGTRAHALAADCLNREIDCWEAMADHPLATSEMADAVQVYLDYCRGTPAERRYVELGVSHQEFHEKMFGTLDFISYGPSMTELVDYKHGIGVVVDVKDNPQLKYYAFAFLDGEQWPADLPRVPDDHVVILTIAQPRAYLAPIRSWDTTAGAIREWARTELHEAMDKAGEHTYRLGEWCRFCPAKDALVCPAQRTLAAGASREIKNGMALEDVSSEWLGEQYGHLNELKMFVKAITDETAKRLNAGAAVPGAKLVYAKVDRVWKEGASEALKAYGDAAWKHELLSPPQVEKQLPGGLDFVAEWSQKPQAGLTVVPESDRRPAQKAITSEEVFTEYA